MCGVLAKNVVATPENILRWKIETPLGTMIGHATGPWHSVCCCPDDFVTKITTEKIVK